MMSVGFKHQTKPWCVNCPRSIVPDPNLPRLLRPVRDHVPTHPMITSFVNWSSPPLFGKIGSVQPVCCGLYQYGLSKFCDFVLAALFVMFILPFWKTSPACLSWWKKQWVKCQYLSLEGQKALLEENKDIVSILVDIRQHIMELSRLTLIDVVWKRPCLLPLPTPSWWKALITCKTRLYI